MSEREELILLQTLKPVETGQEFQYIPPHMTVLSWFAIHRTLRDELVGTIDDAAQFYGKHANYGIGFKREKFSPEKNVPVTTMLVGTFGIHDEAYQWAKTHKATFKYPDYARDWRPHITHEQDIEVEPDELITFSSLALFSRQDTDTQKCKVVEYAIPLPAFHTGSRY